MNNKKESIDFDTLCVHAGEGVDPLTKALRRPIHMANSYELPTDLEELLQVFSWDHLNKFQYTREHSATPRHLEERLAALEGSEDCVVAASGMGAVAALLFTLLNAGDHIVASEICYTGTQKLLSVHLPRFGVQTTLVDTTDLDAVRAAIRPETKAVLVETPGNPLVFISDMAEIAALAHEAGATMIVDSTWSGLISQNPIRQGADVDETLLACRDIQRVGHDGNYLLEPLTLDRFKTEHFIPSISDRDQMEAWKAAGRKGIAEHARAEVARILEEHTPPEVDSKLIQALDEYVETVKKRTIEDFEAAEWAN